jgi:uracil-DNA glycosylase family 4
MFQEIVQITKTKEKPKRRKATARSGVGGRGCEFCPLDKARDTKKIMGRVKGKKFFVWGQSPGPVENKEGKELLGKSGEWLWEHFEAVGITREMCDIQNVVRCFPADDIEGEWLKMRSPSKEEIHCCSIYSEQALEKSKARVHLILGQIAHKVLLKNEYRKDRKIFWSERMGGWVVCLDHPSFFVRGAGGSRERQFMADLKKAIRLAKMKGDKYAYLAKQDYKGITTAKAARQEYRHIKKAAIRFGKRIASDLEEGILDRRGRPSREGIGRRAPLVCGFSDRPGRARVFALDHPDAPVPSRRDRRGIRKYVKKILTDRRIRKAFHHGSYDTPSIEELLGYEVEGYDYDTNYSEYLAHPDRHSYALSRTDTPGIAEARFPQFTGYKAITAPEGFTKQFLDSKIGSSKTLSNDQKYQVARKMRGGMNLALLSWKTMVMYNGADCDVTKRIEVTTKNKISLPLLRVYKDAAYVLDWMEKDGPKFDYKHSGRLKKLFPIRMAQELKEIRRIAKNKDFNPNSHPQVHKMVYDVLKLPKLSEKPDTRKETMLVLAEHHPFPKLVMNFRGNSKICGTYLQGFEKSADMNNGRLRTIWWLTGTRTGRLSSGGGEDGEDGIVNLQNIHGDPQLQNLLMSDEQWYDLYEYWKEHGPFRSDADIPDWIWDVEIFLGFDHAQMELRVLAEKSGDKVLIMIFSTRRVINFEKKARCKECEKKRYLCTVCGQCEVCCPCEDPHSQVGHELTGWKVKVIKNDERIRRLVKNMQFGIIFGLNEDSLFDYMVAKGACSYARDDSPKEQKREAEERARVAEFHRKYFERFRGVERMIENDRAFAEEHGYVETLTGFRRELDVHGGDQGGAYWGNQAVNTPIQGTAHHLMLMGLVPIKRKPKTYKLLRRPQLEVHDAIYFRIRLRNLLKGMIKGIQMLEREPIRLLKREFKLRWKVPLKVDSKAGFRFGCMVKDLDPKKFQMWEFLNKWCEKNRKMQKELRKELRSVRTKVA